MSNPVLNAIKIQSKVVIPIVRELEKEIGALMPCGVYFMVEELVRPEGKFERMQTRSKGAVHCDFQLRKGTQSE